MRHGYWQLYCVLWISLLIPGNVLAAVIAQEQGAMCNMQEAARLLDSAYFWNGECQNGLPHGYGMATFADGRLFTGTMQSGLFSGSGTIVLKGGDRYTGSFADGKFQGQGVYSFVTGDRYVGEFVEGLMHGRGIFRPVGSEERYLVEYANGERISFSVEVQAVSLLSEPVLSGIHPELLRRMAKLHFYMQRTLGLNVKYTSGLRDTVKNSEVGGILDSFHLQGRAVDLVVPGITKAQEALVISFANQQGLGALWHGTGDIFHLHLQMESE